MAEFDELLVVGLLDVVGAHALEYIAEQVELLIGIRGGRPRGRAEQYRVWLSHQQGYRGAGHCTEEKQVSFAHHPRTFSPSFVAHQGLGSMGVPSLRNST